MATTPARRAALRVRRETERGRRLDRAFAAAATRLDERERSFAHELAYGTTRLRGRLDHLIGPHVHRGLASLDARVLEILRLGAYQLLYMGGVPDYAAVSESVGMARQGAGAGAAGLVNAVLRRVAESGDGADRFPAEEREPAAFLSTWGSHPRWLIERWLARWAPDRVRGLVEAHNARPETYLVPLDAGAVEARAALRAAGVASEVVADGSGLLRLATDESPSAALAALPASIVQDPAAHLVVRYADVPAGTKVADLCAAPGGKAVAVSRRALYTLAADRSEARIGMVRENVERTRSRVGYVIADARRPPLGSVDVVLLDVPCTGTGTLSRHPDARWRLRPASIAELALVQRDLLDAAAGLVPVGGLLVYATCSLEPEENEEQVAAFLARCPGFRIEPTAAVAARDLDDRGCLSVLPGPGRDGSFAARLWRVA